MDESARWLSTYGSSERADLGRRLRLHVERLATLIGPRHLERPATVDAAMALIEREFAAIGDITERQSYPIGKATATNLVVERAGGGSG
jgi:hypothetical protein